MDKKVMIAGIAVAAAIAGGIFYLALPQEGAPPVPVTSAMHSGADTAPAKAADQVVVPELSQLARSGEVAFNESCAVCHGKNAAGTENGPPLIHNLYRPGHHSDAAIFGAAMNGVIAHHWRFGNMPPVEGITEAKLRWIVAYVREMQVANGVK